MRCMHALQATNVITVVRNVIMIFEGKILVSLTVTCMRWFLRTVKSFV